MRSTRTLSRPRQRLQIKKQRIPKNMTNVALPHFLILSAVIFSIGVAGVFINRKNIIVILMSIELMLLAVNINFVAFSVQLRDLTGQIFSLLILTTAAAEAAIGLAILVAYYRNRQSIMTDDISQMRG
jgi:NADH-quinone oxidoreductase subunit K